jgi:RNA polymerase sigma-70 factor (ECF subfamily)
MGASTVKQNHQQEFIERARGGDRAAFDALFTEVRDRLAGFIRSLMGPSLRRLVDAEDVLQETLLRGYQSIAQFEWQGAGSFCRWLEGIASHVLADAARRAGRKKELQIVRDPSAKGLSPSRHLRREERFGRLKKCIEGMSEDYRTVILLSRIEGLTIKEIARRMDRSEGAVKMLVFRAMRELKKTFGETQSLHLDSQAFLKQGGEDDAGSSGKQL